MRAGALFKHYLQGAQPLRSAVQNHADAHLVPIVDRRRRGKWLVEARFRPQIVIQAQCASAPQLNAQ